MFETVHYVRGMEVIYPTEIGSFAAIPTLNTAAMKDELVAGYSSAYGPNGIGACIISNDE